MMRRSNDNNHRLGVGIWNACDIKSMIKLVVGAFLGAFVVHLECGTRHSSSFKYLCGQRIEVRVVQTRYCAIKT